MKCLVYSPLYGEHSDPLASVVRSAVGNESTHVVRRLDRFLGELQRPHDHQDAVIIMPASHIEMAVFESMPDAFELPRLIVVLQQQDETMLAQAHKLRPRFVTTADNGLDALKAVLGKMLLEQDFHSQDGTPPNAPPA